MDKIIKKIFNAIRRIFDWKNKENVVAQGLQVWDENGNIQVDVSDKITTVLTVLETSAVNAVLTYSNDLFLTNDYFYLVTPTAAGTAQEPFKFDVGVSGSKMTIEVSGNDRFRTIYIGIY